MREGSRRLVAEEGKRDPPMENSMNVRPCCSGSKRERAGTPARRSTNTTQPAATDAAAVYVYGLAHGARVSGAALAELQLLSLWGDQ
jgi:hypothetical protein